MANDDFNKIFEFSLHTLINQNIKFETSILIDVAIMCLCIPSRSGYMKLFVFADFNPSSYVLFLPLHSISLYIDFLPKIITTTTSLHCIHKRQLVITLTHKHVTSIAFRMSLYCIERYSHNASIYCTSQLIWMTFHFNTTWTQQVHFNEFLFSDFYSIKIGASQPKNTKQN